jgi:serine/threonine protein kinase
LLETFIDSRFDTTPRSFSPEGSLTRLITESAVISEVAVDNGNKWPGDTELITFIRFDAIKIFATAVYIGLAGKKLRQVMSCLQEHGISDVDLPLRPGMSEGKWKSLPRIWSKSVERRFCDDQWKFLAPVFTPAQIEYDFAPASILPFTEKVNTQQGAFSRVFKAVIHQDHLVCGPYSGDRVRYVAVKEILEIQGTNSEHNWHMELNAMNRIAELNHVHILRLIAGFRRGEDRYLLLEWADGGSLKDLWGRRKPCSLNRDMLVDWLHQFRGLANALDQTHNYHNNTGESIRHGDLKPENILVFEDESTSGCLKIGDWGLAKTHKTNTEMRGRTTMQYGTLLYEAPETVVQGFHRARSRLYDIWSLGCVYLEHLIWLVYDDAARRRFVRNLQDDQGRCAYYQVTNQKTAIVHEEVDRWIDHMLRQHPEGTCVGDLLVVIKTKLLVVDLLRNHPRSQMKPSTEGYVPTSTNAVIPTITIDDSYLPPPPSIDDPSKGYRASAAELVDCLDKILDKLNQDAAYGLSGISSHEAQGPPSNLDPKRIAKEKVPPQKEYSTYPSVPIPIVKPDDPSGIYVRRRLDESGAILTIFGRGGIDCRPFPEQVQVTSSLSRKGE